MSEHEPKPVGWFAWDEGNGYEEVPEQLQGEEWTIPLYPASVVTALREEVGRLKRELEDADALIKAQQHDFSANNIRNAEDAARANAAEQRLREAVKVLEPFAEIASVRDAAQNQRLFLQLLVCPEGDTHKDDWGPRLDAARTFRKEAGE